MQERGQALSTIVPPCTCGVKVCFTKGGNTSNLARQWSGKYSNPFKEFKDWQELAHSPVMSMKEVSD